MSEDFGLPAALKEARLVLANTGWTTVLGNSSTSHDPGISMMRMPLEGVGRYRSEPTLLMARCIYQHAYRAVLDDGADLKAIHGRLVRLRTGFPILFADDGNRAGNYYASLRQKFVEDLGFTVVTPPPAAGSVEALLGTWGNEISRSRHLGPFDEHNIDSDAPARKIFRRGAPAMIALGKLGDDRRLTRQIDPAIMKKPEGRKRLGDLADELLEDMKGANTAMPAADVLSGSDNEREYFERAAVERKAGKVASLLGYDDRPTEFWTKAQWKTLREKVRAGLAREKLPDLG